MDLMSQSKPPEMEAAGALLMLSICEDFETYRKLTLAFVSPTIKQIESELAQSRERLRLYCKEAKTASQSRRRYLSQLCWEEKIKIAEQQHRLNVLKRHH